MSFENNDEKIIVELYKLKKFKEIHDENNKLINEFFREYLQKRRERAIINVAEKKLFQFSKKNIDIYDYSLSLSWYSNDININIRA